MKVYFRKYMFPKPAHEGRSGNLHDIGTVNVALKNLWN